MKEFFAWLFSQNNSELAIGLFDKWHFLYLFIIFGGTLVLSLMGRKFPAKKSHIQNLMAYLTVGLYIIDFFIMPLSDSYDGISAYKLPFNICTIMAVLVPFVQFNPKFAKIRQPVVTLSIASSLMWMCYPGTALGGQPPLLLHYFPNLYVPRFSLLLGRTESILWRCGLLFPQHLERIHWYFADSRLGIFRQRHL